MWKRHNMKEEKVSGLLLLNQNKRNEHKFQNINNITSNTHYFSVIASVIIFNFDTSCVFVREFGQEVKITAVEQIFG